MMKKLYITMLLFMLSFTVYAGTNQVIHVYQQLINVSHLNFTPKLIIRNDNRFNAEAANGNIYLNTGVLRVATMSGIAFVLAHEIAHYIHGHSHSTPYNEYQADATAFRYVQLIGFNGCSAAHVLVYTGSADSTSHPANYKRYKALGCGNF